MNLDNRLSKSRIDYRTFLERVISHCSIIETEGSRLSSHNADSNIIFNTNEKQLKLGMNLLLSVLAKLSSDNESQDLATLIRSKSYSDWKYKARGTNNLMQNIWVERIGKMKRKIQKLLEQGVIHNKTGWKTFQGDDGSIEVEPIEGRDVKISTYTKSDGTQRRLNSEREITYRENETADFVTMRNRAIAYSRANIKGRRSM